MFVGVGVVAICYIVLCYFFFQAEDGIRDLVRSRGLGDVYKRQDVIMNFQTPFAAAAIVTGEDVACVIVPVGASTPGSSPGAQYLSLIHI